MSKVYKYRIEATDEISLSLPKGAKVLSFGTPPEGGFAIWALVNPNESKMEKRRFRFAGTGHDLEWREEYLKFIGTAVMNPEPLVFHLFEIIEVE